MTRRIAWAMRRGCEHLPFAEQYDHTKLGKWCGVHAGDLLYVRENFATDPCYDHIRPSDLKRHWPIYFACGEKRFTPGFHRIRPSIHLPKWASRITLLVEAVKVEPLQSISDLDAVREGIVRTGNGWGVYGLLLETSAKSGPTEAFRKLWTHINGRDSWNADPAVVALRFEVIEENVETVLARITKP